MITHTHTHTRPLITVSLKATKELQATEKLHGHNQFFLYTVHEKHLQQSLHKICIAVVGSNTKQKMNISMHLMKIV